MSLLSSVDFVDVGGGRYINVSAIKEVRMSSADLPKRIDRYLAGDTTSLWDDDYIRIILFPVNPTTAPYVNEEFEHRHEHRHMIETYQTLKHLLMKITMKQV